MDRNFRREKRAYVAYLAELNKKEYLNKQAKIEDDISIAEEIEKVDSHLNDLELMIKRETANIE